MFTSVFLINDIIATKKQLILENFHNTQWLHARFYR